jgi:ubiquinone/menaquinone biosynthesis C-methylase UbiE
MTEADKAEHVQQNLAAWQRWAPEFAAWAPGVWSKEEPSWGIFSIPDTEVGALPSSVAGLDVIELGCGTAYFSAWMAKRGAHPVGIDISPAQLETARAMQVQFGLDFPLHLGNAEETRFPDESFDLVISEYGASIWCDPYRWIPEAARLLRPGGTLAFLVNSVVLMVCTPPDAAEDTPASECLKRPYFGLHRVPCRTAQSTSPWSTGPGFGYSVPTNSRWRTSTRSRHRRTLLPARRSSPANGLASGRPRRSGWRENDRGT